MRKGGWELKREREQNLPRNVVRLRCEARKNGVHVADTAGVTDFRKIRGAPKVVAAKKKNARPLQGKKRGGAANYWALRKEPKDSVQNKKTWKYLPLHKRASSKLQDGSES